ncbi:MAG: metal ABC transporter ATP-binding protein [Candidatus Yonathbacteria bacterium]|nr:metal ABC transporter ATP-binding protein [Candidatus Yonathbacteria bacterium]
MNDTPYIQLEDVNFSYNKNPVLEGISFTVHKGDYIGIIGPNGGGKTTLLKVILGLLEPESGVIRIMGQDIHSLKERSIIGYVPQRIAQAEHRFPATVEEIVETGRIAKLGLFKRLSAKDREAVGRAMDITGVSQFKDRLIGDLSGGEMKKVFIARALAGDPKILVLDEPTTGVDVGSQKKFYEFLGKLNREHHLTIIFVSHDVDMVSTEARSVICLNKTLVCEGPSSQLHDEEMIKKLYGDKINLVVHQH